MKVFSLASATITCILIAYLYALHDIEFCASHISIRAIEEWAWHGKVYLGES